MSSSDPRSVIPLLTIDERTDVRRSIAKARVHRNHVRQSIAKVEEELQGLLFCRKQVTKNISQLKKTLAIHRILPIEIISYIFSILCTKRVSIPHNQDMTPPQITVSHVCSKWREIALATPALWNNIEIVQPGSDHWVQVAQLLLNRAGRRGVILALNMEQILSDELGNTLYDIVLPLHVKKLHLTGLCILGIEHLLRNSDDIIANIDEIALNISDSSYNPGAIAPQFLSKIRSLICTDDSFIRHQNLPWAQMRYLNTCNIDLPLSTVSNILRQSPLLEDCKILINVERYDEELDDGVEPLALPQLRIFHIIVSGDRDSQRRSLDAFLQPFKCPNLTDLSLEISSWALGTYNLIRNQYNLHQLLKLNLTGYPYPISKILHDAPVLQELAITRNFILMDESAIHAISSGKLGRCLILLGLKGNFDVRGVLDMMVARQRCVKQIVEAGRGWQDQISGIKKFFMLKDDEKKFKEQVGEVKKLGIDVSLYHSLDSDSE